MCSATDNELKHINEKLDSLVDSQKDNAKAHIRIEAHIAVSVERWEQEKRNWEAQKEANKGFRDDIDKVDNRNKVFASLNGLAAFVAGLVGVNR